MACRQLSPRQCLVTDMLGSVYAIADSTAGHLTSFAYDAANRLLSETNPLGQVTSYGYNPDGTRATKKDGKGNVTKYAYDANGRLSGVTFADGSQYLFAYDSRGHRTLEQSPDESRSFTYDALGRMASATDAQLQKTIAYGYDAAGNRTRLSYDGLSTAYGYDPANRLSALTDPDGETSYLTYDPGGRRASLAQGNGVVTSYGYDAANRTLSIGRPGALPSFAYSYDLNGNPLTKSYTGGTQDQYFYDPANRLIAYTGPSGVRAQYGYTGSGDLQVIEGLSSTGAPTFETSFQENAFDQVTQFQPGHALITYGYDANGNRTGQTSQDQSVYPYPPQQVTSYSWTDDDRLGSVTLPSGQLDAFKYDANGIRVGKSDSTGSVRYLIDPLTQAILATYDAGTGLRLTQYNQNPQKLDEVFSVKSAQGTKLYPHTDMLGSVYAVSDSTGTSQATWSYDVYGTRTQTSGSLGYAFGFTGREHDGDTGLIYSRARYYDPSVGSWLSPDRKGDINGPNLFQYVVDRPTRLVDPSGQDLAVILSGAVEDNPFGHVAVAITGFGVFSFGTSTPLGSSLADYVASQDAIRKVTVFIAQTDPAADARAYEYLLGNSNPLPPPILGPIPNMADTCATRTNGALSAAGLPYSTRWSSFLPWSVEILEHSQTLEIDIPKGTPEAGWSCQFDQFEGGGLVCQ